MRTITLAAAFVAMLGAPALAETFPVIKNETVLRECGDCHMAFPPQTLPRERWVEIINDLENHFGENAALPPDLVQEILDYHVRNASDVSTVRAARKWRTRSNVTRITDAPRFRKKHGRCQPEVWTHEKVRSKSNCLACHKDMQRTGSTHADVRFLPAHLRWGCEDD